MTCVWSEANDKPRNCTTRGNILANRTMCITVFLRDRVLRARILPTL